MLVNPAEGALVRHPSTRRAIEPGTDVDENDPYFARLLIDGDLVPAPAPSGRAAKSEESK